MRQLILHVGMHKTGTTSIQRSLDGLSRDRVKYVALGSSNHSGPMSVAFGDREAKGRRARPERSPEDTEALKQRIRGQLEAELAQKEFDKFVISGEGMVFLTPKSLRELHAILARHVDEIKVFAYVRDPVGFSSSALQQRIKGGFAGYELTRANYRAKFVPFIEIFGRENFSVKEFSRPALRDGSVVSDFCHHWGIPFDPKSEVRSNESLAEPTMKLMHLFNRSGVPSLENRMQKQARMAMVEAMGAHFKGKFDLPVQFRAGAIDRDDIAWLAKECGVAFPVDPSMGAMPTREFEQYINQIDPGWVSSYRELLAKQGIEAGSSDSTVDLLNKHFAACLAQSPEPRQRPRPAGGRRRGAAGLRGLRL
ncbi:MAG: hypothetical protein K0S48_435 [Ramlibacter sp.]|jgi:hypothetical protein|nr:hypothetical protein [Ramlibacter sp.]MCE3270648.1 hypothetical protein [Ramlibacter sp.]